MLDAASLERELVRKGEETILGLFDWEEATFVFIEDVLPCRNALTISLEARRFS